MQELSKKELLEIEGGVTLTAALLSALVRGASVSLEVGRSLGSSIRRLLFSCTCDIK